MGTWSEHSWAASENAPNAGTDERVRTARTDPTC